MIPFLLWRFCAGCHAWNCNSLRFLKVLLQHIYSQPYSWTSCLLLLSVQTQTNEITFIYIHISHVYTYMYICFYRVLECYSFSKYVKYKLNLTVIYDVL